MSEGAGKGDAPRPVDGDRYREGWERIFGGKDKPPTDKKDGN